MSRTEKSSLSKASKNTRSERHEKRAFSGIVSRNVMNHFMPSLINIRDRNRCLSRSGTGSGAKQLRKMKAPFCLLFCVIDDAIRVGLEKFTICMRTLSYVNRAHNVATTWLAMIKINGKRKLEQFPRRIVIIDSPPTTCCQPTEGQCHSTTLTFWKTRRPSIGIGDFGRLHAWVSSIIQSQWKQHWTSLGAWIERDLYSCMFLVIMNEMLAWRPKRQAWHVGGGSQDQISIISRQSIWSLVIYGHQSKVESRFTIAAAGSAFMHSIFSISRRACIQISIEATKLDSSGSSPRSRFAPFRSSISFHKWPE